MQKNYKKFLQGAVAFPIMAMHLATTPVTGGVASLPSAAAIFPEQIGTVSAEESVNPQLLTEAAKIDAYFAKRKSPLVGYGLEFAQVAEKNDLPYNLLPAIATIESGAGTMACRKDSSNIFGFMSCKGVDFESYSEAIDTVARTITAQIPSSAYHYEGKTIPQILVKYNGNANKDYVALVYSVMKRIDQMEVPANTSIAVVVPIKA